MPTRCCSWGDRPSRWRICARWRRASTSTLTQRRLRFASGATEPACPRRRRRRAGGRPRDPDVLRRRRAPRGKLEPARTAGAGDARERQWLRPAGRRMSGPAAPRGIVLEADGLGSQCADAIARVPADRDRGGRGVAGGNGRRLGLGQPRRLLLQRRLGDEALDQSGRRRGGARSPSLGQQRPDDLFFFVVGLEARREFDLGELRARSRFTLPVLAAVGGMAMAIAIYLAFNVGDSTARGLGHRDVDGHRVRPGSAGHLRAPRSRPPAGVHPHRGRGRRHPRPDRHRHRLHRDDQRRGPARRRRAVRGGPGRAGPAPACRRAVFRSRSGGLGGAARVRESSR